MHGVWTLKGTLIEPGYPRAALSIVWMVVIFLLWIWVGKLQYNHPWPEFQRISAGVVLLLG